MENFPLSFSTSSLCLYTLLSCMLVTLAYIELQTNGNILKMALITCSRSNFYTTIYPVSGDFNIQLLAVEAFLLLDGRIVLTWEQICKDRNN